MPPFKFALCNEVFEGQTWAESVRIVAAAGYDAIEIAPFTLAESVTDLSASDRQSLRREANDAGLTIAGLHWLFVSPKGLHVTTDDPAVRQRTAAYLRELVRFCGDLGGKAMIIGSPKQREVQPGSAYEVARQRFIDVLTPSLDLAREQGVSLCIEALAHDQTNFITSLAEAVELVQEVGHPSFQTMFDVHNAVYETEPLPELLRRYLPYIRHVHVNEMDGGHPGSGDFDFGPILRVLEQENYQGHVSTEAFDLPTGGEVIARRSIATLRGALQK